MNIAITGGGTGGHLAIANALKEELNSRGMKPIFIGSQKGQDRSWFETDEGFQASYFLDTQGVVNKRGLQKITVLRDIFSAMFTCKEFFKRHKIDAAFCVGGYSAAPASLAALFMRKPLYIHEQNAITGSLNKILKPFSKAFFSSYHKDSAVLDYPVSTSFFEKRRTRKELQTIIFLGGSQGASFINQLAMDSADEILKRGIKIIHQTGQRDFEKVQAYYKDKALHVECFSFSKNLLDYLTQADFAISRAGASTLWELSANTLPSLFVPFPYAAKNHQYHNAKVLVDKQLGFLQNQDELTTAWLLKTLDSAKLEDISLGLKDAIRKDGIKKIADIILQGA